MNKIILLSITCSVFALTSCDHYSERLAAHNQSSPDVSQIMPAAGGDQEMTFSQYLASEYYYMARYEQNQRYDYKTAKYYTEKAESLARGEIVGPSQLSAYKIAPEHKDELARAYDDLTHALTTYNIPENRYSLAMAQSRFDCWLEQQEDYKPEATSLTCQNEFRHAMASLIAPDTQEVSMLVPFDTGSMMLSEEARISIGRALSFWNSHEGEGYKMTLRPNNKLQRDETDRQISMVRSILQFNGIPASEIAVDYIHPASVTTPETSKDFAIVIYRRTSPGSAQGGI